MLSCLCACSCPHKGHKSEIKRLELITDPDDDPMSTARQSAEAVISSNTLYVLGTTK